MSDKHDLEEDYFARLAREKKDALNAKMQAKAEAEAATERKVLHYNKCGKCGSTMQPKLFKGVEIDICEACGAVLLDPGELEELAGEEGNAVSGLFGFFFSGSDK